jgi:DNA-binding MarR family transcriptional regulator
MPKRTPASARVAAEAWRLLFDFFILTRQQRDKVLSRVGLTPNDVRALASLEPGDGRTMRSLADEWVCDASNATWMVDRLEKRGLARRLQQAADRRVRLVQLTPLGARIKAEVRRGIYDPPAELLTLTRVELERLRVAAAALPTRSMEKRGTDPPVPPRR